MADLIARRPLAGRHHAAGAITLAAGSPRDAERGLAYIDVTGAGTLDLLGIAALAGGAEGVLTTRLAALRVSIAWSREPETAQVAVERFSADYLWAWLVDRAMLFPTATGAGS